ARQLAPVDKQAEIARVHVGVANETTKMPHGFCLGRIIFAQLLLSCQLRTGAWPALIGVGHKARMRSSHRHHMTTPCSAQSVKALAQQVSSCGAADHPGAGGGNAMRAQRVERQGFGMKQIVPTLTKGGASGGC